MYTIYHNSYYKLNMKAGTIFTISMLTLFIFVKSTVINSIYFDILIGLIAFGITCTIYCIVKCYNEKNNFIVLRVDEQGIFLCPQKDKGTFMPWDKIKYLTFAVTGRKFNDDVKIAIWKIDNKAYYLSLTKFFYLKPPKKAMREVYKYADDKQKIKFVEHPDFRYESIFFSLKDKDNELPVLRQVNEDGNVKCK